MALSRRWVERRFAWMAKFHRLAHADEREPEPFAALDVVAVACLALHRVVSLLTQSP